jgi:hypothetical protein
MIAITRPSHRTALLAGLALIAGVNAIALGGVAWNRGAEDARLALSERELRLPYTWRTEDGEDPGLSLQLDWRNQPLCPPGEPCPSYDLGYGQTRWLDADKLAALGFDVAPRPRPQDSQRSARAQEREVVLVLEFAGPAYVEYLEKRTAELRKAQEKARHAGEPGDPVAEAARPVRGDLEAASASLQAAKNEVTSAAEQLRQAAREDSRLFAVDAGLDREALRRKYPDRQRYAFVPALVGYTPTWEAEKFIAQGRINRLLGEGINVPLPLARKLGVPTYRNLDNSMPSNKFVAQVAFGRRLEPWLLEISPAASP